MNPDDLENVSRKLSLYVNNVVFLNIVMNMGIFEFYTKLSQKMFRYEHTFDILMPPSSVVR